MYQIADINTFFLLNFISSEIIIKPFLSSLVLKLLKLSLWVVSRNSGCVYARLLPFRNLS